MLLASLAVAERPQPNPPAFLLVKMAPAQKRTSKLPQGIAKISPAQQRMAALHERVRGKERAAMQAGGDSTSGFDGAAPTLPPHQPVDALMPPSQPVDALTPGRDDAVSPMPPGSL